MSTDQLLAISKALSDRNRLRLLLACLGGERCVCQLTALLGLSVSTVSKHLSILKQAGLLESRKEGRWMHYRAPDAPSELARDSIEMARRSCAWDVAARADAKRLREILKVDPEELCRMQRGGADCCPPLEHAARTN